MVASCVECRIARPAASALLGEEVRVTLDQHWLLAGGHWGLRPFAYPPSTLLVLAPLAQLPFWTAYGERGPAPLAELAQHIDAFHRLRGAVQAAYRAVGFR